MTSPRPINDGVGGVGSRTLEEQRRTQEMQVAWRAYMGAVPNALKTDPGAPDVNVKANRLAPIVNTGTHFLFGLALKLEIDPASVGAGDDDTPDADGAANGKSGAKRVSPALAKRIEAAQDALNGAWGDEDDMMTLMAKLGQNGGVFGHAFAKILPPDAEQGHQYPRLVVLDPQNVTVQTDDDDCDTVCSYTITYDATLPDGSQITKRQIIARRDIYDQMQAVASVAKSATGATATPSADNNSATTATNDGRSSTPYDGVDSDDDDGLGPDAQWVIANYAHYGVGGHWAMVGAAIPWPHPWPPIVDCQNLPISNQHWGQPDITPDLIQLNQVLNFVLSNINSVGLNHGHPWIWASGADMSQVTTTPGGIITLRSPEAKLEALIANGDIQGLMAFAADLRSSMDEQSGVPGVATGRIAEMPKGQMSGVAVRMLYMPLMFKTSFKKRTYGKLIREASSRMLALMGYGDGTDAGGARVTLHWQDPMPTDDLAEAQTAQTWQTVGVSSDTLLQRGGFDPDDEAAKNDAAQKRQQSLQTQGAAPLGAQNPPPLYPPNMPPGQQPSRSQTPPTNHPAAVAARQRMQAANGKAPTPNGL